MSNTLLNILYELKSNGVLIWYTSDDSLSFSILGDAEFREELKNSVVKNKKLLIKILEENGIDCEEKALSNPYYKIPLNLIDNRIDTIQKGMLTQSKIDAIAYTYTVPLFFKIFECNTDLINKSIINTIEKNPILRMCVKNEYEYSILPISDFIICTLDIKEEQVDNILKDRAKTTFLQPNQRLLSLELINVVDSNYTILNLTHHHILTDAFSADLIKKTLENEYKALENGNSKNVEDALILEYFDHVAYQKYSLTTEKYNNAIVKIRSKLEHSNKLSLPLLNEIIKYNDADTYSFSITADTVKAMNEICSEYNFSLYSLLVSALYRVCCSFSGGINSFPLGLTVSNRPIEFKNVIGPFLNTLPLICEFDSKSTWLDNIELIQNEINYLNEHHNLTLSSLLENISKDKIGPDKLIEVLFTMHNFISASNHDNGLNIDQIHIDEPAEKFDITIIAKNKNNEINFLVTYLREKYSSSFINEFFVSFKTLLNQFNTSNIKKPVYQMPLLSGQCQSVISNEWNNTLADFPSQYTLPKLFEKQALKTPNNIAVIYNDSHLSYKELNAKANQLANYILDNISDRNKKQIGVYMNRSENMLVGIIAILKAGCAYVPIDPDYPEIRTSYIIMDSQAEIILTDTDLMSSLQSHTDLKIIPIDCPKLITSISSKSQENLLIETKPSDLAYIIYTSGTTGNPKGVMIEHSGIVNRIHWMNRQYPLSEKDRILQKTPFTFDVSVWELFWAGWYGAAVVFAKPNGHKEPTYLKDLINKNAISVLHFVPSMLSAFSDECHNELSKNQNTEETLLPSLKRIFCSGEALSPEHFKKCKAALPHVLVHNLYGPTEASVDVLFYDCNDITSNIIPIGKPIDNTQALIVDKDRCILPVGAIGELMIGGIGLARGYINKPELTSEKFTNDKLIPDLGYPRLYKTGDLARWLPDGNIQYLGRNDNQIKVRGFRIELSEIENAILKCQGVQHCAVVLYSSQKDSTDYAPKHLLAYYVSESPLSDDTLTRHLLTILPQYMVPDIFYHLREIPLSHNGKLDRKALPKPVIYTNSEIIAPTTSTQIELSVLWKNILSINNTEISIKDDFFKLGGDSILAIQLVSQARHKMGVNISAKSIFQYRTIDGLARLIDLEKKETTADNSMIKSDEVMGDVPLLPIQEWFFNQKFCKQNHWNQSFLIKVPKLDTNVLHNAIHALVEIHDSFHLRYQLDQPNSIFKQFYKKDRTGIPFEILNLDTLPKNNDGKYSRESLNEILTLWQSDFDIIRGPLYRFAYIYGYEDGSARIYIACHHLVIDSYSWRIITEDLFSLYNGKNIDFNSSSYRQWVQAELTYESSNQEDSAYWNEFLKDYHQNNALLAQKTPTKDKISSSFSLTEDMTLMLLKKANNAYHSEVNDLLLSSVSLALSKLTSNNINYISLEGHGREEISDTVDISRTTGWFTTIFPVKLTAHNDIQKTILETKDTLRKLPKRGFGYGKYLRDSSSELPCVLFNYLGQIDIGLHNCDWVITDELAGNYIHKENLDKNTISIFAFVVKNVIKFHVSGFLEKSQMQKFSTDLESHLIEIVEHCSDSEIVQYTWHDFENINSEHDLSNLPLIPNPKKDSWFEMTDIQKAYLLGRSSDYEIGNVANHLYCEYIYDSLNVEKLESIINYLVKEHEALRTVFCPNTLKQRYLSIDDINEIRIPINDFRTKKRNDQDLNQIRKRLSHHVYDITCFPLFTHECTIFEDCIVLHFSIDLIMLDVQSRLSLFGMIDDMYRNNANTNKKPDITFKDYQDYTQYLVKSKWYSRDRDYWLSKIRKMPLRPTLSLKIHPEKISYPTFSEHTRFVPTDIWAKFKDRCTSQGMSISSALLSLYGKVISYFSSQNEFLITVTLFNRYSFHEQIKDILGDFTSTILFHYDNTNTSAKYDLTKTHDDLWSDINHALYSGVQVQRDLSKIHHFNPTTAVSPIVFTAVVGTRSNSFDTKAFLEDSEHFKERFWCAQTSQAWIDLQAVEVNDQLMSKWLYVDQLFDRETIEKMNILYTNFITYLSENNWDDMLKSDIYLSEHDKKIISKINSDAQDLSSHTLISLYEDSIVNNGHLDNIAVYDQSTDSNYTHKTLMTDSSLLGSYLHNITNLDNFDPSTLIAVLCEKNYNQVLTCLSILKSGHAYLPLNVDWPLERVIDVCRQGRVKYILTTKNIQKRIPNLDPLEPEFTIINVDEILQELSSDSEKTNILNQMELPTIKQTDIAYVIFTSGSTGKPKGVTITHNAALNTLTAVNKRFNITHNDSVLALSDLSFDLSVYDIFGMLIVGGKIVLPSQGNTKSIDAWVELVQDQGITIWNTVPQLANLFINEIATTLPFNASLRLFLLSGDWIPLTLPKKIKELYPASTIMSLGGATEASIWSIWYEVNSIQDSWKSIPYGMAMPNQKIYVLNQALELCPTMVSGEIYIGGIGVAKNYWLNDELTKKSFINHSSLGNLYKTGDLGRTHPDGYIEFLGRNDFQVKLNGYRVELEEVEKAIMDLEQVEECVVVVKNLSKSKVVNIKQNILIAYCISDKKINENEILKCLSSKLPDYMLPTLFIQIDRVPLSPNGKVDLNSLPQPVIDKSYESAKPRNTLEKTLQQLLAEILGIPEEGIGIHDDFFFLGGDSIISIQLAARIRRELSVSVTSKDIFSSKTIANLAHHIKKTSDKDDSATINEQGLLTGRFNLLPIQDWFFKLNFENPDYWNQCFTIDTPILDTVKLSSAITKLVEHHDSLRLLFNYNHEKKKIEQEYNKDVVLQPLTIHKIDNSILNSDFLNDDDIINNFFSNWEKSYSITKGPLLRFGYFENLDTHKAKIVVSCHHLLIDTVSIDIIIRDLKAIYNGKPIESKATSFRQWIEIISNYSNLYPNEISYWTSLLKDFNDSQICHSSTDNEQKQHSMILKLDTDITNRLHSKSNQVYSTKIDELIITALNRALTKLNNNKQNFITLEGHGRNDIANNIDISNTVGWFTSMYPVKLEIKDDLGSCITHTKETLRNIPNSGLGYGKIIGLSQIPLPKICFNYVGKLDRSDSTSNNWSIDSDSLSLNSSENNRLPFDLGIFCFIKNDQLEFSITSRYSEESTLSFVNYLRESIIELDNYLSNINKAILTPSDIDNIISLEKLNHLQSDKELDSVLLANSLQQGFIYHNLQQGNHDDAYRVQIIWSYNSHIDTELMRTAWSITQNNHSSLRLRFDWEEEFIQIIDKVSHTPFTVTDISRHESKRQDLMIEETLIDERKKPFDFSQSPLFRLHIIKLSDTNYKNILTIHHAILDGWSGSILLSNVHNTYLDLIEKKSVPHKDSDCYIEAQRYIQRQKSNSIAYWEKKIKGISTTPDLTGLLRREKRHIKLNKIKKITEQRRTNLIIDTEKLKKIQSFSQSKSITINAILQFAWHKTLKIYGNCNTTIVGTIASGRNIPIDNVDNSIGCYINTLPLIYDHSSDSEFPVITQIQALQNSINELNDNCIIDLSLLQKNGQRIFDTLFMFGNYPNSENDDYIKKLGVTLEDGFEKRDYPLSVVADIKENKLSINIDYSTELFDKSSIESLLKMMNYLIDQIIILDNKNISDLKYIDNVEMNKILYEWNMNESHFPHTKTIHELIQDQAIKTPSNLAIKSATKSFTYLELNDYTNQLALYIRKNIKNSESNLVALYFDDHVFTLVSMIATMKSGLAYVPLDSNLPTNRLVNILDDSQAGIVLTLSHLSENIRKISNSTLIEIDSTTAKNNIDKLPTTNLDNFVTPFDLAYVIYTSGTTGKPKGVSIPHQAFISTIHSFKNQFFSQNDTISTYSITKPVFDIFGLEYGLPLTSGGTIELDDYLNTQINCMNYDFVQMTPGLFESKNTHFFNANKCTLILGGEKLTRTALQSGLNIFKDVINAYGPTETTIWSTAKLYTKDNVDIEHEILSIGKPLSNEKVYILDKKLNPVPVGVVGDLYIGGSCLSTGYLNAPELTAQKFIPNRIKCALKESDYLYKTGDLARWLEDGNIDYIGRDDFQIKLRGHRIELGDIESALQNDPRIKQCVVLIKNPNNSDNVSAEEQFLVAYYTSDQKLNNHELKINLSKELPKYMIPSVFQQISKLPLTINGKIDRASLQNVEIEKQANIDTPCTAQEEELLQIWSNILKVSNISVNDNFFDLGGNSLLLIKMYNQLPDYVKAKMNLVDFFSFPNIRAISEHINNDYLTHEIENKRIDTEDNNSGKIAIIGISCRFPKADNLEEYWSLLKNGDEGITHYTREELLEEGIEESLLDNPNYVPAQSVISDYKCFDAEFFGYSQREAELMDPQHRVFLESVWHALEDAQCDPKLYAGDIGIYAGLNQNNYVNDHVHNKYQNPDPTDQYQIMINNQANFLCTRVAHKLDLRGPAITVQTACSTSLVAVHEACKAIITGDCDMAIAGAVSIRQLTKQGYLYQQGLIYSPDATCRPFDDEANGTFEGQGVGVIVLKPLDQAIADNNRIYAVIEGSAINNDGQNKIGFTAPSAIRQAAVIKSALKKSKLESNDISYIETHGTGTKLGDPIEFNGLIQAFSDSARPQSCALGSVKANIGHLDVAAGMAGLIKTALCLFHKTLVPTLHYKSPNNKIPLNSSPFYINTELKNWESFGIVRRAGVSSFGIGGTNAHVVLAEPPEIKLNHSGCKGKSKNASDSCTLYKFKKTEYWIPHKKNFLPEQDSLSSKNLDNNLDIKSVVYNAWKKSLGVTQLNGADDFFHLGGDSLIAKLFENQISTELGLDIDVISLPNTTLSGIIEHLENKKKTKIDSGTCIIKIKEGSKKSTPLIMIHPVGGDVYFYRDLCKALSTEQTIYAIRCPILKGRKPYSSIEEMASEYLSSIEEFGIRYPFILGGSSFGGVVAHHMACLLEKKHNSKPTLIMIDSPAPGNMPNQMNKHEILEYIVTYGVKDIKISLDILRSFETIEEQIKYVSDSAKSSQLSEILSEKFLPLFINTWLSNSDIMTQYKPDVFNGKLIFFSHSEIIPEFPTDQYKSWYNWVNGEKYNHYIKGNHLSMNASPNIEEIGYILSKLYFNRDIQFQI